MKIIRAFGFISIAALLNACSGTPAETVSSAASSPSSSVISVNSSSATPLSSVAMASSLASTSSIALTSAAASSSVTANSSVATGPSLILQETAAGVCAGEAFEDKHTGFTATGYINSANAIGAVIRWRVNAPQSQLYSVEIRYANGGAAPRSGDLSINGGSTGTHAITLDVTGAWTLWDTETVTVELIQGDNTLELVATSTEGLANIDYLKINGSGLTAGQCPDTPTSSSSLASSSVATSSSMAATSSTPSSGDSEKLMGWAAVADCGPNGTTGGGTGPATVTVTNTSELQSAMTSSGAKVIAVKGKIEAPESIGKVIDKTLIGLSGAEITGGLTLRDSNNVIIRNILFSDGSGGSNDTLEIALSTCIWIDHNTFRDGLDGNLDVVRTSNYITISWNRFYYTRGHDHMLSNLNGNSNDKVEDEGKIKVTFHHNWWGAGVKERMPRTRFGDIHVFNNYYKYEPVAGDTGQNYNIGVGFHSRVLVENNYFDGSKDPMIFVSDDGTGEIVERGNAFVNTSGSVLTRGSAFVPPYPYTLDNANDVKAKVMAGAGPK